MDRFDAVRIESVGNGFVVNIVTRRTEDAAYIRTIENDTFVFESFTSMVDFLLDRLKDTGTDGANRKKSE